MTNQIRLISVLFTTLVLFIQPISLFAQEALPTSNSIDNNQEATPELNSENTIETAVEDTTTQNNSNKNFDVFLPSEDISEDLAVPFPVDI